MDMQSWNKAESDDDECNIGCNSKMKHAQICSGATTILLLFIQKNISTFNKLAHQKCLKMKKIMTMHSTNQWINMTHPLNIMIIEYLL